MRFLFAFTFTVLLGWLSGLLLPFWSLSLAALLVGFLVNPGGNKAFPAGALAGAVLWGGLALALDSGNASILSARIAVLFKVGHQGPLFMTLLVGALLAGLGLLVGDRARTALRDVESVSK